MSIDKILVTLYDDIELCDLNCPEHRPLEKIREKVGKLLAQAEARGREIVVEMVESFKSEVREASPADDYERGYDHGWDDCKADLLTKLNEDSHD